MIAKRYPWKPEYATNSELFWHDLRENERKYAEEYIEQTEEEPILDENYEEPINITKELALEDERRQYIKSLLGVKE